ncbi:MAG: hypothetical protein JSU74_04355 [Candidatus Zixiibacteriota bacterium]|nr:MAG: hypothetical protein JSU74_04355 [candidate division Zixibacteria bacterium]
MKKTTAILLLSCAVLLAGSCSEGNRHVDLRFKYAPDMLLKYEQISKGSVRVIKADTLYSEEATNYHASVTQEVTRLLNDTTAEVREIGTWESTRPSEEDSTEMVTEERRVETLLHILPNGKIADFEVVDLPRRYRASYVKSYFEQGMPVFPSGERPIGYSWTQTTKVVLPEESMEASTTYEIKSLVRYAGYDCAVIEYQGNLVIPVDPIPDDSTRRQGLDRVIIKGIMYFGYKDGLIIEQRESWNVDGERRRLEEGEFVNFRVEIAYTQTYRLLSKETKS